ncbi:MAG: response regulator [Rhodospirillales bacterium]|nr:response regulator [Rhodospirillales bacterium]
MLIANPDRDARDHLCRSLSREGCRVYVAGEGLQCLRLLHELQPDLLVLDLELRWGGADGVLALMSEDPLLRHIPVAITSSVPQTVSFNRPLPLVACAPAKPYLVQIAIDWFGLASKRVSPGTRGTHSLKSVGCG